jgi:hypothetical protein
MRSALKKELATRFRQKIERRFPKFSRLKESSGIWQWQVGPECWLFIALDAFDNRDEFTVEIAWSQDGKFPWASFGKQLNLDASSWRDRLRGPNSPGIIWDLAPEVTQAREKRVDALLSGGDKGPYLSPPPIREIMPRIGPAVDNCFAMLEEKGWPILVQAAEHRGLHLDQT